MPSVRGPGPRTRDVVDQESGYCPICEAKTLTVRLRRADGGLWIVMHDNTTHDPGPWPLDRPEPNA